jgi:hypothetical protein
VKRVLPSEPSERQIQREILDMCGKVFPDVLLAHVPNGTHLFGNDAERARQMGTLKGDGLKVGFPDLIVLWDGGCGFLEVKRPGGKLSDRQAAMHAKLVAIGHHVAKVESPFEAQSALLAWGAPATGTRWRAVA